jgi:hypothetical protein
MAEVVDRVMVTLSWRAFMTEAEKLEIFAAYTEMEDAAESTAAHFDAAGAAVVEIAKFLTRFEDRIDDEWRAMLVHIGGGLIRLHRSFGGNHEEE